MTRSVVARKVQVPQQNVEPIMAMYVDDAHNDIAVPPAHAWDETIHAYPQPHVSEKVQCPPFGQRQPRLFFRGGARRSACLYFHHHPLNHA